MTSVPLGIGAYNRTYGEEPEVQLLNRFFEQTPTNQVEGSVLLARPGNTFFLGAGSGPMRKLDFQPGVFNGDLFFVSGEQLFRYDGVDPPFAISGIIQGTGTPSTTLVSGPGYEHLFIADGLLLQFYGGEAAASGTLTVAGGNIAAFDTFEVDGAYYEWTSGSVDAGTPAGTMADPWLVALGSSDTEALANALDALNASGTPGTTYSTALGEHTTVQGVLSTATALNVKAKTRGVGGNSITTTETGANISWAAGTLEGGGAQALNGVVTPDDVAMVSLSNLASFVIAVVANSQRYYWIQPGAVTIDALDFAEAESEPDQLIEVIRIGDVLYFIGETSTEVWYASGAQDAPFLRQQGLAFSQGVLEGTAVAIRTQIALIAEDGKAYKIAGGPQRFSNHGIEERIRFAIEAQEGV